MVHDLDELEATWFLGRRRLRRSIFSHMHTAGQELIIQECLGPVEMGLEIINTLSGRTAGVMARRKLGMRAGETDRAVTVDDPRLTELGWRVGEALQHDGCAHRMGLRASCPGGVAALCSRSLGLQG
jgi:carbamoyl-phosphate synthase large subunit